MTFSQQVWLTLVGSISTACFVAILGTIVAGSWTRSRERQSEAVAIRTKLLEDAARIGQGMYVFCQHTRRLLIQAVDEAEREAALIALDERFLQFSIESATFQTLVGARLGVVRRSTDGMRRDLPPFLRWHQIHDLLSLYYFNLKGHFPGIVFAEASYGYGGNFHSGLNLDKYSDKENLSEESLREMRREIRTAYDEAMIDFTHGVTTRRLQM